MKHLFLRLEQRSTALALLGSCAMLAVAASLGLFQVVMRFVFEAPAEWTEVLIRFSLIWMVFLGIAPAFRNGAMINVDVLHRRSGVIGRRIFAAIAAMAALMLIAVVIWWGWDYAVRGRVQTVIGLEDVSMFWAYLALPVGGLFSVLGIVGHWIEPRRHELETAL
ncbi:MAG: TRAP transporter small permease [Rubrivivax sp.]